MNDYEFPQPPTALEAIEHLSTLQGFAYEMGYHEIGYDPVDVVRQYMREQDEQANDITEAAVEIAALRATVAGLEKRQWDWAPALAEALDDLLSPEARGADYSDARETLEAYRAALASTKEQHD